MKIHQTFSYQLLKSFLFSTLIPFLVIAYIAAHIYSREYDKDVQSLLDSTATAINSNIVTYLNELEQVTLQPYYNNGLYNYLKGLAKGRSYDSLEKLNLQRNLDSNMSFVRDTRKDINGIYIVANDRCLYYTTWDADHKTVASPFPYENQPWYQKAVKADGNCLLFGPHVPDYVSPGETPVISLIRSIVVLESRQPLYIIKIDINTSIFNRMFQNFNFHVASKIIIKDENQQIIYTNKPLNEKDRSQLMKAPSGKPIVLLEDGAFRYYSYPITGYPWSTTVLLSDRELNSRTQIIYLTAILLYLGGVMVAIAFYYMLSQKMVTSISSMKDIFEAVQNGIFEKRYDYVSHTELDALGSSLNVMAKRLQERIQREYVMTIHQKDIELKALLAQIQPHFLFNTLNTFIALNQTGKQEALENALFELSDMIHYILKAPPLILLSRELSFINNYCTLQKLRFGQRLSYQLDQQVEISRVMIPKLLLQPIVENSILHGVEPCLHPCTVKITLVSTDTGIRIIIGDDGAGYEAEALHHGIGLCNVRERLSSFSPKSSFTMESRPLAGTRTTIDLYL